jgi:hypothetical protein
VLEWRSSLDSKFRVEKAQALLTSVLNLSANLEFMDSEHEAARPMRVTTQSKYSAKMSAE